MYLAVTRRHGREAGEHGSRDTRGLPATGAKPTSVPLESVPEFANGNRRCELPATVELDHLITRFDGPCLLRWRTLQMSLSPNTVLHATPRPV